MKKFCTGVDGDLFAGASESEEFQVLVEGNVFENGPSYSPGIHMVRRPSAHDTNSVRILMLDGSERFLDWFPRSRCVI